MTIPIPNKETPEEMRKRIRAEMEAENPPDAPPSLDPSNIRAKKSGGDSGMGGMKLYIMIAGISLIIAFLVVTFVATTPFNKSLKTVNTTAASALTSANTAIASATKAQSAIDGAINDISSLKAAVNDINNRMTTVNTSIKSLQDSIAGIPAQLKGFVTSSQVSGFATSDQITAAVNTATTNLQTTITALKAQLTTDEATIATDEAAIKALQAAPTTTTTTTTPTTTPTTPTAGLVTTSFYNSPMVYTKTAATTTEDRTFGIEINNGTTKDLVYVSLTVTLQSSVALTDKGVLYTLTSNTGTYNWTLSQETGGKLVLTSDAYIYVAAGDEVSDNETLDLNLGASTLNNGSYTVSVTSIVLNSKTLQ